MSIMTVRGPIDAAQLGKTSMHEHIWMDGWKVSGQFTEKTAVLNNHEIMLDELRHWSQAGGDSIVEVTCVDLGRNPAALKRLSEDSGVHIVMSAGYFTETTHRHSAPELFKTSTDDLAAIFVREIEEGVDGVCAGILAELGNDYDFMQPSEERVFRAAARAHKKTGVPISTHTSGYPQGLEQCDLLIEDEGADPGRIIIGHCDLYQDYNYYEALVGRGVYLAFDLLNYHYTSDAYRLKHIKQLVDAGHSDQIVLATDSAHKPGFCTYGGAGYAYLLTEFVDKLQGVGIADEQIDQMLVRNPAKVLDV